MIYLISLETALKCQNSSHQPNKLAGNIEQGCLIMHKLLIALELKIFCICNHFIRQPVRGFLLNFYQNWPVTSSTQWRLSKKMGTA